MYFKILLLSALLFLQSVSIVRAVSVPDFPTCSNPQGTLKVSFENGVHGIAGNPGEFTGGDKVYTVDSDRTVQCFCSSDGSGVQTSWWKISSLSQEEIQTLKNLGWIFIPSGSVWGLDAQPYMALNTSYRCTSSGTGGEVNGSSTSSSNSNNGSVLGLAATGNALLLVLLPIISIASFVIGLKTRNK